MNLLTLRLKLITFAYGPRPGKKQLRQIRKEEFCSSWKFMARIYMRQDFDKAHIYIDDVRVIKGDEILFVMEVTEKELKDKEQRERLTEQFLKKAAVAVMTDNLLHGGLNP